MTHAEPPKKTRKRDKSGRRSHSSPRCHRHGADSSSQPLSKSLFGRSMRFSESVSFNLCGSERQVFRSATIPSIVDATIKFCTRSLLICTRLKEEIGNSISSTDHGNLKRELVESGKTFQSVLDANTTLLAQVNDILDTHSHCDSEKEDLKDEITTLIVERFSLQTENKNLKRGLNDLSSSNQVDAEKIIQLKKELYQAQNFVIE